MQRFIKVFHKITGGPENLKTLGIALFVVLLIRSSVAAPYKIPTGSMRPTLQIGDHLFVSKLAYGLKLPFTNINLTTWSRPKRGDVIVFKYPKDPRKDYIKRVVGLPGDRVEIRAGQLYVNGKPVARQDVNDEEQHRVVEGRYRRSEHYRLYLETLDDVAHYVLHHRDYFYEGLHDHPPVVVKEDHYFVMGDNRHNSRDSREWGFVSFKAIRGRALVIFFSLKKNPWGVRWSRFGRFIH